MAQYGKTTYWDERYTKDPSPFDWYQRYSSLRPLITTYIPKTSAVLVAGCGNSRLTEDMYEDGYGGGGNGGGTLVNVDISKVVIDQMVERYKESAMTTSGVQWVLGNVCSLEFPDESFEAVVAKGTLDAVLCGEGSTSNLSKLCSETSRILSPSGVFLIVSYGVPDNRLNYLENDDYGWSVTVHTIGKPTVSSVGVGEGKDANSVHYVYVCQKGGAKGDGGGGDGGGD